MWSHSSYLPAVSSSKREIHVGVEHVLNFQGWTINLFSYYMKNWQNCRSNGSKWESFLKFSSIGVIIFSFFCLTVLPISYLKEVCNPNHFWRIKYCRKLWKSKKKSKYDENVLKMSEICKLCVIKWGSFYELQRYMSPLQFELKCHWFHQFMHNSWSNYFIITFWKLYSYNKFKRSLFCVLV